MHEFVYVLNNAQMLKRCNKFTFFYLKKNLSSSVFLSRLTCRGLDDMPTRSQISLNSSSLASHSWSTSSPPCSMNEPKYWLRLALVSRSCKVCWPLLSLASALHSLSFI
ncbi:hypothetical protein BpHYR1_035258 [Brachionus plicatilis]|uniref:Uncharacterized protein n=1 Tax=Brachionus plicatilis TaxID=10195 RepID=A0A3M7SAJ3_BRAPC|nr:hypothetical protein BpHYR1_035258 [Brachionus plicatilis]